MKKKSKPRKPGNGAEMKMRDQAVELAKAFDEERELARSTLHRWADNFGDNESEALVDHYRPIAEEISFDIRERVDEILKGEGFNRDERGVSVEERESRSYRHAYVLDLVRETLEQDMLWELDDVQHVRLRPNVSRDAPRAPRKRPTRVTKRK